MDLNESEVVAASSGSCPMTGFGISHDESLDYAITVLLSYLGSDHPWHPEKCDQEV
jgi:hypothetical protein